jgi:hypothetical protein
VDDMVDTHLINVALTGYAISAGVAILISAAIIAIAAIVLPRKPARKLGAMPVGHESIPASASARMHERTPA